ncbi:hypothetical protein [Castellaniella sp.]|uniref:hypothetical protein n=1 Tax=Castellaniella sp. TaxID=1955812 RepID=UPI002B003CE5|nr:hypothetical protein [Castellaniella sp.]
MNPPITPPVGSVVYVDLIPGYMQHSGVYVGDGQVIELNRDGLVCLVGLTEFSAGGLGQEIHVSCKGEAAVGRSDFADRAWQRLGEVSSYHLLLNNCHQFTAACMTGQIRNPHNLLRSVKLIAQRLLGADPVWQPICTQAEQAVLLP